ncbi:MAG: hypothetical protein A2Z34_08115 [Planctomycetes bacterium RBG_16_59_8]|nr:MAG: hypothetical protein A2Z34_08115 [Planctomycetes bacterium RBG_16_59_8]
MARIESQLVSGILRNANLLLKVGNRLCGKFGITQQQWVVLEALAREPKGLKLSDLGKDLLVTKSNITGLVDRLERDDYVLREVTADDRRVLIARITEKGQKALEKIRRRVHEWYPRSFSSFSREEKETMLGYNQRLFEFLYQDLYRGEPNDETDL